ncbi:MAG: hypothetical protein JWQ01_4901 [Massilia sp.]|nr:hypothetical protein [Massilia sp.]
MNPYSILAGLVLLIAVAFGGAHVGKKLEREAWQAEKIALQAAQHGALVAEMDKRGRDQKFNEAKARKATETHEKALSDLDQKYAAERDATRRAGGLRIPANVCAGKATGGEQATSAGRPDESAAATVALPERLETDLYALTKQADELAEQLRALQGWIVDNGFYGEPPKP